MCSVSSVLDTFAHSNKTETLSSYSECPWISLWLLPHRRPWSALWSAKAKWHSDRDSGNSILMHRIRRGVGESCLMGSISLKPHWFAVGVTGAQVTVGSPQLEMNSCSLMRSRDERVANYPELLCTGNNLLLLGLSMINLLQLLLYLFYTLKDLRGV